MKKATTIMLSATAAFVLMIAGIFIGRSSAANYLSIPKDKPVTVVAEDYNASKLDINRITYSQLLDLPDIGDTIAMRIIAYRNTHGAFTSIDQLLEVEGIGEGRLEQLKDYLTIGG